jgi:hypothetical protein
VRVETGAAAPARAGSGKKDDAGAALTGAMGR